MWRFNLIFLILAAMSCDKSETPTIQGDQEIEMEELITGLNHFQWKVVQEVVSSKPTDENINISPLSIAAALYMTHEGAGSTTREGIQKTVELSDESVLNLGMAYQALMDELGKNDAKLISSNAIFWDKTRINPSDHFLMYTDKYYDAGQFALDFSDSDALPTINTWVKNSTQDRIEKILDGISQEEVMFLINALYFKADWKYPFPLESTGDGVFTKNDGTNVNVDFLSHDTYNLKSYAGADFSAVEMPFSDSTYSMTLILPKENSTPDQLISDITSERLVSLYDDDLQTGRIFLSLPKLKVEYKILLNDALKALGMEEAFDRNKADFSNLGSAPEGNLFITKVNHKTFLEMDEKGVEGAAVTSVGVGVTSLPPSFDFDRPFVFLLRNTGTNALIFAGKIEDPAIDN